MKRITEKISEKSQFPLEVISSVPKIEITDNNMIFIENHKGIKLLTPEIIIIKLSNGVLNIEGEKMSVFEINKEYIYLTGIFNSLKFDKILR